MRINRYCFTACFVFLYFFHQVPSSSSQSLPTNFFEKIMSVEIDETSGSFLSAPSFSTDKNGNYIITDFGSHHVQIFNLNGEFLNKYGRFGQGPGDFERPTQTIRLNSGNLLTVEANGKLTKFSPDGEDLIEVFKSDVIPATQITELRTGKILIGGRMLIDGKTYYLHLFDLESGSIQKSFLNIDFQYEYYQGPISMIMDMIHVDTFDEKISAVLAPFSDLYFFDLDGNQTNKISLNLENFKDIEQSNSPLSPQDRMELFDQFSMFRSIHWINENELFLQFFRKDDASVHSTEATRYFAMIESDGTVVFEQEIDTRVRAVNRYKNLVIQDSSEGSSILEIWKY